MDDTQLTVELLCGHHELDRFDCGHDESNTLARALLKQVRAGCTWRYQNKFLAVAVAAGHDVIGMAAACDLYLDADLDADGDPVEGKCLFYYLLATERSPAKNGVAALKHLCDEMDDIQAMLVPSDGYIGELAMPDRADVPAQVEGLAGWLEHRGFRPLGTKPYIWFRPR